MRGIIKERLFTPGPTPLRIEAEARTLAATVHHRTEAFRQLVRETLESLRYFFNTQNDVLIFTSSGTGAMEGALANLLSPRERVLVGTAGKFGERWLELAQAYGAPAVKVESPYGHPLDVADIGRRLKIDGPFRAVFVQATESSTGVMHDVKSIGGLGAGYPQDRPLGEAKTGPRPADPG